MDTASPEVDFAINRVTPLQPEGTSAYATADILVNVYISVGSTGTSN